MIKSRKRKQLTGALAIGAVAAAAIALVVTLPRPVTATVQGEVRCLSNSPLVGIWVVGTRSPSGYATWYTLAGDVSRVTFTYDLGFSGSYSLHVGCGGTKESWILTAKSGIVSGSGHIFLCNDVPNTATYLVCSVQPKS